MTGHTHSVAGAAAGALAALELHMAPGVLPAALALGFVGGLLPDIDEPGSTVNRSLNRIVPFSGTLAGKLTPSHRTATHSLAVMAALWAVARLLLPGVPVPWVLVFLAGYASHLCCDMLTPRGIELFWPFKRTARVGGFVRTGGWLEQTLFLPGFAALAIWAAARAVGVPL